MRSAPLRPSRVKSLTAGILFLFFCGSNCFHANLFAQETNDLSIEIIAAKDPSNRDCLPYGVPFDVVLFNHSNRPLLIWQELCEPGHKALSFRIKETDTKYQVVQKRTVPASVWTNYPPKSIEIPAGKSYSIQVNFLDFFWGDRSWANAPEPNIGENIEISAVFEINPTEASRAHRVWSGQIESARLKVLVLNPKLKSPQDYLWNDCPQQALKLLEANPALINSHEPEDYCTPLHHAARFGYTNVVVWLIQNGAVVNSKAYNDFTPLHLTDRKEIAKILIKGGANLNQKDAWGKNPFQRAAEDGHSEVVDAILEAGYKMDLYSAILLKRRDAAIQMLVHDSSIIVSGDGGSDLGGNDTPLGLAAGQGDIKLAKLLLAAGAPINDPTECPNMGDATALCNAVWAGKVDMVEFLLKNGAATNFVGGKFYDSITEYAEKNSDKKIVDLLKASTNRNFYSRLPYKISTVKNKLPERIQSGDFQLPPDIKAK